MKRPRVLVADDHCMMAEGLKSLLHTDFQVVGVVGDGRALLDAVKMHQPDVIVADIAMPHLNGLDALAVLKKRNPDIKVVFLTMHGEVAYARRALQNGALGFVLKHSAPAELVLAIRAALEGKTYVTPAIAGEVFRSFNVPASQTADPASKLTPRQREVLQLLAEGQSAKEIAAILAVSARTVEYHKYQLMESLGLHTNAELVHFAIKHGLVSV